MSTLLERQADYWDREAEQFHTIYSHQKTPFANMLDRVLRRDMYERYVFTLAESEPIAGRTFLDVGCGSGVYAVELARRGAAKVIGLDIAPHMLEMCRNNAAAAGVAPRCEFVHADLLEYVGGRFSGAERFSVAERVDVSIGIGLFDYVDDPLAVLKAMQRITSDRVIASFPRFWTWRAPVRKVRLSLRGCDVYFYTAARVRRLMRDAGFARVEIHRVGKLHCVVGYNSKP